MDLASLARAFRADGFATIPSLVAADDLGSLTEALEQAPERDPSPNPLSLGTMRFASNLFYGSEVLQRFLSSSPVVSIVTELLGPEVWARWDQAVWKHDGAPEFPLHQDNGYTGLDAEHVQLWVALTAMDESNGGLVVVPGSHGSKLDHTWVGGHVVTHATGEPRTIDAAAGDAIVFSSYLPHATTPNRSGRDRLAYVAEFLPMTVADPSVAPPHFVVAEGGRPSGRWIDADEVGRATRPTR